MKVVGAMILAAGRSRRMGAQKLLLPLGSSLVIARVVDEVCGSTIDGVSIVVGADAQRIAAALGERRVQWLINPDSHGDMLSSIRCGLRGLPSDWDAVMVVLGDQPGITTATLDALLSAFRSSDLGIALPTCQGRRGHPLIFDRRYAAEILERFDEVGLRGLPQAHAADVLEVPLSEDTVLDDMDDPADYRRLQSLLSGRTQAPLEVGKDVPAGEIYQVIARLLGEKRPVAVATVIHAVGSTPRKVGAKAVIEVDGRIHGTIGGGLVEAEAQRRGLRSIEDHRSEIFECRMEGDGGGDASPICGGVMRVVIDPNAGRDHHAYTCAAQAIERRERGLLLTRLRQEDHPVVSAEWISESAARSTAGFPGADRLSGCLDRDEPCVFVDQPDPTHTSAIVVAEPVIPRPLLLIVGGGHVGQAVAAQARRVGFDIAVIEDRPEFAHPALFPEFTALRCGDIAAEVAGFPVDADTYIVLVTRGHRHDAAALAACIRRPAAYLGMIGSTRKVALVQRDFLRTGRATTEEWGKVFAPIGLPIGAETVPEIAASIVAQLIAVRRGVLSPDPPRKTKSN